MVIARISKRIKNPYLMLIILLIFLLDIVKEMINEVKINKKNMYNLTNKGYITATDLADWIVKKTDLTLERLTKKQEKLCYWPKKKITTRTYY